MSRHGAAIGALLALAGVCRLGGELAVAQENLLWPPIFAVESATAVAEPMRRFQRVKVVPRLARGRARLGLWPGASPLGTTESDAPIVFSLGVWPAGNLSCCGESRSARVKRSSGM
jgi:hypothetical protein